MSDPIQGIVAAQQLSPAAESVKATESMQGPQEAGPSFQEVFEQQGPQPVEATQKTPAAEPVKKSEAAAQLDKFVEGVFHDEKKMQRLMKRVERGQTLSQGQLLELQGVIYGYAQKVDIASKVVDKSTAGLKQVMNTQV